MATTKPRALIAVTYEEAAREYLRNLPPEHFMEATALATQRKITLESLDLLTARRPDVHLFNELLVQYPLPGQRKPGQVVPKATLVDWIWGEQPPADAANALQRLVSRLRKALPAGVIEGRAGG